MSDARNSFSGYGLAIETSGRLGSVAIGCGGRLIEERCFSGPRKHASEFIATIDTLCRDHGVSPEQIGEVYVSYGPGSFAGLRIGVTAARMIALAHGASVIATPTLDVIAQNALWLTPRPERVAVILDAKRKRVYAGGFDLSSVSVAGDVSGDSDVDRSSSACNSMPYMVDAEEDRSGDSEDDRSTSAGNSPPYKADSSATRNRSDVVGDVLSHGSYVARSAVVEVDPATFLAEQPTTCLVMGEGAEAYARVVEDSSLLIASQHHLPPGMTSLHTPRAGVVYHLGYALARTGKTVQPRELIPLYIRPPEAEEQWAARHGA